MNIPAMQTSLFEDCPPVPYDPFEAKNEALIRVEQNANPEWKEFAYQRVVATALRLEELTSDDVDEELNSFAIPHRPVTHCKRALGPVLMRAAKEGVIKITDRFQRSRRTELHNQRLTIWRSLIYQPTEGQLQ